MSGARLGDPGRRPGFPGPRAVWEDVRYEHFARRRHPLPAGFHRFSVRNTFRFRHDPLNLLLEGHERFGPMFGVRISEP